MERHRRTPAPELTGRQWLNTAHPITLNQLRGKIVLLDFWTFCCINCLHVLEELRPIEEAYANVLVTLGVHSPKFEHEAQPHALAAAVERYQVSHPVLDDPQLSTWQRYGVRAWPTLVVVDPEGNIAGSFSGEGHGRSVGALCGELVAQHRARGTLRPGASPYEPTGQRMSTLSFPSKALAMGGPEGSFLVADTGHHRLVELESDLTTVRRVIGSGARGARDGGPEQAQLNEPAGLARLPQALANACGYEVVVADTVNHRLRGVHLPSGNVRTVAGTGDQRLIAPTARHHGSQGGAHTGWPAETVALSSPWDLVYSPELGLVVIAMAGVHQIFGFDPLNSTVTILAGTGQEALLDGEPERTWFAQPSGIARDQDGNLWVADSETSALRLLTVRNGAIVDISTPIGAGLFDFGHRDGSAHQARLQHPLGLTALPDGSIVIADTYNGAIRHYTQDDQQVRTLLRGLDEPGDVIEHGGHLIVVESNRHRLTRIPLPLGTADDTGIIVDSGPMRTARPATELSPGAVTLTVGFTPPRGQKIDDTSGAAISVVVSASPDELLLEGSGPSTALHRKLALNPQVSEGTLHIRARVATCDDPVDGAEHAACYLYQQDWGVPVVLAPTGTQELSVELR